MRAQAASGPAVGEPGSPRPDPAGPVAKPPRRHAVLVEDDGGFSIEDLGSLNGTFVNRRRIEESQRLGEGDEVQIGKYRLTFMAR